MFFFLKKNFNQGVLEFNLVVLGVYKVQGTTKEEFGANVIWVEMEYRHLYITHHAIAAYQTKHRIVNNDMV